MARTEVVVGRIGRAHGIKGEVSVEPRTDEPERRFVAGGLLGVQAPSGVRVAPGTLTVRAVRWHQSRLLVTFAELPDRTAAEAARGLVLVTEVDQDETPQDPEEFYDHQLVGLTVRTSTGDDVGEVAEVAHGSAQDLLVVRTPEGAEVLIPFVNQLVPVVDVAGGWLEVVDLPGLLRPDETAPEG